MVTASLRCILPSGELLSLSDPEEVWPFLLRGDDFWQEPTGNGELCLQLMEHDRTVSTLVLMGRAAAGLHVRGHDAAHRHRVLVPGSFTQTCVDIASHGEPYIVPGAFLASPESAMEAVREWYACGGSFLDLPGWCRVPSWDPDTGAWDPNDEPL